MTQRNKNGVRQLSRNEAARPTSQPEDVTDTGVTDASTDQTVAERAGADDKVAAVAAEDAKPKVPTYTPEGRAYADRDPHGLRVEGIYGKGFALLPEMFKLHAQVHGSLDAAYQENVLHGPDPSAPAMASLVCKTCNKPLTVAPVRTALIDQKSGDLVKDRKTSEVIYRGQFVTNGPDLLNLPVHVAHLGDCLYKPGAFRSAEPTGLRVKRDRNGHAVKEFYEDRKTGQKRWKWALLDAQSFDQATARAAGVKASEMAKRETRNAEVTANQAEGRRQAEALGFKVGDTAVRHNGGRHGDDGINRGAFEPKTPRGQSRTQRRRWADEGVSK